MRTNRLALALLALFTAACDYDPPPEAALAAPVGNRFLEGEPIVVAFSEPVAASSVEVVVWPGRKDFYDREGERLSGVEPLLSPCRLVESPCGADGGVALSLNEAGTELRLELRRRDALGPFGEPLVLEVTGRLRDRAGRAKRVSRFFDFLVEEELRGCGDGELPAQPLDVRDGAHLFFAEFTSPISLPQQFFGDIRVDRRTGTFVLLMTDADPVDGADRNTSDPAELVLDTGEEGFVFTTRGCLTEDEGGLLFEAEPFTLTLSIGPIDFELRDLVLRGRVRVDEASGRQRWDGTLAVAEIYYAVPNVDPIVYPADQANFEMVELRPDETPAGLPRVCDDDPCARIAGPCCDLPSDGDWPPPVCESDGPGEGAGGGARGD